MIHPKHESLRQLMMTSSGQIISPNDTNGNSEAIHGSQRKIYRKEFYNTHNRNWNNRFRIPVYSEYDPTENIFYYNTNTRTRYGRNSRNPVSNTFDSCTRDSTTESIRQNDLWSYNVLTPPATISSSRSTLFSCNSAPPFYTDFTHCVSPTLSDDFERPNTAFTHDTSDYYDRDLASSGYFEIVKGCYTKEDGGVIYGQDNIYTAETVHSLVKSRRDGSKKRIVSNKVFVGGIPHAMNRETINAFFASFGTVFVDWPLKAPQINARGRPLQMASYSYLFLVYCSEKSVLELMRACHKNNNEYFVNVPGCRESIIQIRPWFVRNAFYVAKPAIERRVIDIHRTVFVGGLPRIVTAEEIATMFSEFGKVLLVTIDIDQDYGYPKGAARVTFKRDTSFNKALEKKYLKFDNIDSSKTTIEIKPYVMEDVGCDQCGGLWFNPFLEIFDHLKELSKSMMKKCDRYRCSSPNLEDVSSFNMWSCDHPFSSGLLKNAENIVIPFSQKDLKTTSNAKSSGKSKKSSHEKSPTSEKSKRGCSGKSATSEKSKSDGSEKTATSDADKNDMLLGAAKFYNMVKSVQLEKIQYVTLEEKKYSLGPDLWDHFLQPPVIEVSDEPVQMGVDHQVEKYLCLKRKNVYSNKSSYCKEKPCRQYYCPSCSSKLHSGPKQHVLLPAGKPERRPRKDKNMYLVTKM